jgi:SAM-dependent methyltransferase
MGDLQHYVIRGGIEGRERLRILSRVMHTGTMSLFDRLGIGDGLICLDVGCGGGDVTVAMARRVAPEGKVFGIDIDSTKLEIARQEAEELGIGNVEYQLFDIRAQQPAAEFDVVYVRFLLTHLPDPAGAVGALYAALKPGGLVIVEDIDSSGGFVFPESTAYRRFVELYCAAVQKQGGDPCIGPRLPLLLKDAGFVKVNLGVTQPVGLDGEMKLMNPITLENIADALVEAELASRQEIAELVEKLYEIAASPETVAGTPRVIQAWGWRPAL